jgi:hypothetical protein
LLSKTQIGPEIRNSLTFEHTKKIRENEMVNSEYYLILLLTRL